MIWLSKIIGEGLDSRYIAEFCTSLLRTGIYDIIVFVDLISCCYVGICICGRADLLTINVAVACAFGLNDPYKIWRYLQ
jgi:hypothetical protein